MESRSPFIGMGHNPNPNVPDIPLGLGMALFQESAARDAFERLTDGQKTAVIRYVQNSATGGDAKEHIRTAVEHLRDGNTSFLG